MHRRSFVSIAVSCLPLAAAAFPSVESIQGTLLFVSGKPLLETENKKTPLAGDESTMGVLLDKRVRGLLFQLAGKLDDSVTFTVGPIHTKSMVVLKNNQKLFVTYWCDICSIRTYTPGICWCCQEETELDLRERYDS